MTGIYKITNTVNGKLYVGSAVKVHKRWTNHKHELRKQQHVNSHLQRAWNKYGEAVFEFGILELTDAEFLITREQFYIDLLQVTNPEKGYNICETAGNCLGRRLSKAAKEVLRQNRLGKKHTIETIEKIRVASTGEQNAFYGRQHSNETKRLISKVKTGVPIAEETKIKMSAAAKGRVFSAEHRAKIAEGNRRRIISDETRYRMSESAKKRVNRS